MVQTCPTCATPLDDGGACVTCAATAEGLKLVSRNGYAQVREMMTLLEEQGLGAEMEKVPPTSLPAPRLGGAAGGPGRGGRGGPG
jgi:hypothetical protein